MTLDGSLAVTTGTDTVDFGFTVTNTGDEARELRFRSGQAAEFVVLDDGREVWRWSDGRLFTQALWSESLALGEAVTYEATWADPAPGEYVAEATLEADGADAAVRKSFVV